MPTPFPFTRGPRGDSLPSGFQNRQFIAPAFPMQGFIHSQPRDKARFHWRMFGNRQCEIRFRGNGISHCWVFSSTRCILWSSRLWGTYIDRTLALVTGTNVFHCSNNHAWAARCDWKLPVQGFTCYRSAMSDDQTNENARTKWAHANTVCPPPKSIIRQGTVYLTFLC